MKVYVVLHHNHCDVGETSSLLCVAKDKQTAADKLLAELREQYLEDANEDPDHSFWQMTDEINAWVNNDKPTLAISDQYGEEVYWIEQKDLA